MFLKRFMFQVYSLMFFPLGVRADSIFLFLYVYLKVKKKTQNIEHLLFLQLCDSLLSFSTHLEKSPAQVRDFWLREVKSLA